VIWEGENEPAFLSSHANGGRISHRSNLGKTRKEHGDMGGTVITIRVMGAIIQESYSWETS